MVDKNDYHDERLYKGFRPALMPLFFLLYPVNPVNPVEKINWPSLTLNQLPQGSFELFHLISKLR
jgi:hypothetical protein